MRVPHKKQEAKSEWCYRCGGLMVGELTRGEEKRILIQRCVNCGEVVDPVIKENKMKLLLKPT